MSAERDLPEFHPPKRTWGWRWVVIPLVLAGISVTAAVIRQVEEEGVRNDIEQVARDSGLSDRQSDCVADAIDDRVDLSKNEPNAGDQEITLTAILTCAGTDQATTDCLVEAIAGMTEGFDNDELLHLGTGASDHEAAILVRAGMRCNGHDATADEAMCVVRTVRNEFPDAFREPATPRQQRAMQMAAVNCVVG